MLAILTALPPTTPPRQLRLVLAIEAFPAEADGWRPIAAEMLMEAANVSYPTFKAARDEVIKAGWVDYERGHGAGHGIGKPSRWRLLVDLQTWEDRVTTSSDSKGGNPPPGRTRAGDGAKPASRGKEPVTPKCRVCRKPLDPDPSVAASGVHPCCEPGVGAPSAATGSETPTPRGTRPTKEELKKAVAGFRRWAAKQPPCPDGYPGGDLVGPDGNVTCPFCREGGSP